METLGIEELYGYVQDVFRTGKGTRPQVSLLSVDGRQAVLKDYGRSDLLFRLLIGPIITWREVRALRALRGIPGIPGLIRQINRRAFLVEYINGITARDQADFRKLMKPDTFEKLYTLVRAMHAHGVAHCDLRSGGNTIIDKDGQPYFVDFVSNFVRGSWWNLPWRWAFRQFCQADIVAVARLRKRLIPDQLTDEETRIMEQERQSLLARSARYAGQSIRNISRFFLTKD